MAASAQPPTAALALSSQPVADVESLMPSHITAPPPPPATPRLPLRQEVLTQRLSMQLLTAARLRPQVVPLQMTPRL